MSDYIDTTDSTTSTSTSSNSRSSSSSYGRAKGPLGIDPLHFSIFLFTVLILFVFYLLLPRGVRKQYFGAYPKRHAWSARIRSSSSRRRNSQNASYAQSSVEGSYTAGSSVLGAGTTFTGGGTIPSQQLSSTGQQQLGLTSPNVRNADDQTQILDFTSQHLPSQQLQQQQQQQQQHMLDIQQTDEIVISAAMQQLRDPGVLIVAHGSRGKPKTVRLQLTEAAITWRTETRRKAGPRGEITKPKMGKLHQVPLSHIMYVDVGKQTTALRRVENAAVPEQLCFSLLTKEGSLDLEANSPRERDALVSCFSLVLDEVHAANWRDIYRGPSSDMPSSFDEVDQQHILAQQQQGGGNGNNPNNLPGQYRAT